MMLDMLKNLLYTGVLAILVAPITSSAQVRAPANCTYQSCALGLAPAWNGLSVVRGDSEQSVATLGFFLPGDVTSVFRDDPEALDAARDAVRIRQIGAALTDGGIVLAATGLARALFRRDWDGLSTALTAAGAVSLGASVPFQFAADGQLSRAVWLFNRRFTR
jgi:hypothetical protein